MNTNASNISKRDRLMNLTYLLFGIESQENRDTNPKRALTRFLLRAAMASLFVFLCVLVISSFEDSVNGFVRGFMEGANYPNEAGVEFTAWSLSRQMFLCLILLAWFYAQNCLLKRVFKRSIERHQADLDRMNRLEIASTLQLLRAQIEPHFLFNTLGLVQHLAEPTAPQAAALTADLIQFLRTTTENLREDTITLERDCETCAAYLNIMQARLPRRIRYQIDCPTELNDFRLPSGVLLTLVENAIKHGIEPSIDGGEIQIVATRENDQVCITVSDTGLGFGEQLGQGLGLDNIRNRLALMYGDRAKLMLEENEPRGVVAQVIIPL